MKIKFEISNAGPGFQIANIIYCRENSADLMINVLSDIYQNIWTVTLLHVTCKIWSNSFAATPDKPSSSHKVNRSSIELADLSLSGEISTDRLRMGRRPHIWASVGKAGLIRTGLVC
jgi:hypothetical protein